MSILNAGRAQGKVRPNPVKSTTLLFDSGWKQVRPGFGRGLLRSVPTTRLTCTVADLQEAAEMFGALTNRQRNENRRYDEMAWESRAMDAVESGCYQM